jgi:hypothetical protein
MRGEGKTRFDPTGAVPSQAVQSSVLACPICGPEKKAVSDRKGRLSNGLLLNCWGTGQIMPAITLGQPGARMKSVGIVSFPNSVWFKFEKYHEFLRKYVDFAGKTDFHEYI